MYISGPQSQASGPVPGHTEGIDNLHYFSFIYYSSLNDVLFLKNSDFLRYIRPMAQLLTHVKVLVSVTSLGRVLVKTWILSGHEMPSHRAHSALYAVSGSL